MKAVVRQRAWPTTEPCYPCPGGTALRSAHRPANEEKERGTPAGHMPACRVSVGHGLLVRESYAAPLAVARSWASYGVGTTHKRVRNQVREQLHTSRRRQPLTGGGDPASFHGHGRGEDDWPAETRTPRARVPAPPAPAPACQSNEVITNPWLCHLTWPQRGCATFHNAGWQGRTRALIGCPRCWLAAPWRRVGEARRVPASRNGASHAEDEFGETEGPGTEHGLRMAG